VWSEDGQWWTVFPPPDGFDGEEEGELHSTGYQRTLTDEEEAVMRSRIRAEDRDSLARCCAVRDRFFGLPPRGSGWFSSLREAEPNETSETAAAASRSGGPNLSPGSDIP
jgi:hypothetical protein